MTSDESTASRPLQSLGVIVPCHNESSTLEELVARVDAALDGTGVTTWEVVVVDDGSTDDTAAVAAALAETNRRVSLIRLSRNFGKEAAILAGLANAVHRHDALAFIDGDLQHPPEVLPELIARFEPGVHQVVAVRRRAAQSWRRRRLTRGFYALQERLTDVPVTPGAGDFRVVSRDVALAVLSMPERARYSKGIFSWVGFSEVQVDYDEDPRVGGASRWSLRDLADYSGDGLTSFNSKPLRLGFTVGIISILLAIAYLVFMLVDTIIGGTDTPGYFTLMAAVLFFGGTQLLFLGVLGQYVGRIFLEVKRRPHYVIADEIRAGTRIEPAAQETIVLEPLERDAPSR